MGLFQKIGDLFTSSLQGNSPEKIWSKWDNVSGIPATDRKARGIGGRLTVVSIDRQNCTGIYVGSDGDTQYRASLLRCSCPDFQKRRVPCKHMYHLAWSCGLNIHLDYGEMMQRAVDYPGPESSEDRIRDFYSYRNTFEMMLSNKILYIIRNAGGRMSRVDIKNDLQAAEVKYFDYAVSLLEESGTVKRDKEKGRVFYSV